MTLRTAVAFFAHTRPESDIADVVRILCALATMSHALGDYRSRDDSIEAAAELQRPQPAPPMRLGRVF
jgi:hypothetical protein